MNTDSSRHSVPPPETDDNGSLYAARRKIHPREVTGTYQRLRHIALIVILGAFYTLCWVPWGDRQIILWDLPARRFHILWMTFYPQDFIYVAILLVLAAVTLLFFTALAGRLWCGYTCPQTLWTEMFLWIERKIEGDRAQRIKMDQSPWTRDKLLRRGGKHALWIAIGFWTGLTFVGYFTPIRQLLAELVRFQLGPWESFWVFFYGFATYGNAGFLREQVCMYMCPYARFQSAMFDRDSLIISYDEQRGEPRGSRRRGSDPKQAGLGDCIDCTMCVQVCPTGIDIRKGLQYECIGCAACIDVCDQVMDRMGYPRGLVRYTTQNALDGKATHVIRPRILIYATILLIAGGLTVYAILTRPALSMDVLRDRNALYRTLDDGRIENSYTLKINNRSETQHSYRLEARGIKGIEAQSDPATITLPPGAIQPIPARVQVPASVVSGSMDVELILHTVDDPDAPVIRETARFLGPRSMQTP
ncbi:MAG: cytochrome c oxidase accessory protein CcoG [Pseudomonadota bacterium]|nr:cytochrome c oxidase accessory protein CcoG [Pseudomonadota bacterium]